MVLKGLHAEALGVRQLRQRRLGSHTALQHVLLQARLHARRAVLAHLHGLLADLPGALLVVGPLFIGDLVEHAARGDLPQHRVLHALVALALREVLRER